VFHEAVEQAHHARAAFVAAQCGSDEALHARVLRLLAAHEASEDFMENGSSLTPELERVRMRLNGGGSGARVGPCILVRKLGEGGFGVVWLAEQDRPVHRQVALKTITGFAALSAESRERFRIEAAAMAALDHPAILPVYQFGEDDEGGERLPFLTMKLATGGTLGERRGALAGRWAEIATLVATMAEAVHYAHEHGVLHRDLKPGNILFDEAGRPYVSDFGMAKLAGTESGLTRTAATFGTPHYMAPEIVQGDIRAATTASDQWALGTMLYELLARRPPFEADSVPGVLRKIVEQSSPPLPDEVPRDLAVIAGKALQKEPSRRYASVRELADDLRRWLDGRTILAREASRSEKMISWARRNPRFAAMAGVASALLVVALISMTWALRSSHREVANVSAANEAAREELRGALLHQARSGRIAREAGWRDSGLAAIRRAAAIRPGLDLRHEAIGHLTGFDLRADGAAKADGWSAAYDLDGVLRVFQGSDSEPVATFPKVRRLDIIYVIFDPTRRWVVGHGASGDVHLYEIKSERLVQSWPGARFHGFDAQGYAFALSLPGGPPRLIRVSDQQEIHVMPENTAVWSKSKKLLAVLSPNPGESALAYVAANSITMRQWDAGAKATRYPVIDPPVSLAWRGDKLSAGTERGDVRLIDVRNGRALTLAGHNNRVWSSFFDPAAAVLVTSSYDGTSLLWDTQTGQLLLRSRELYPRSFSQDGRGVFLESPGGNRWGELQRPAALRFFSDPIVRGGDTEHDISPDGRMLAVCGIRGLEIFDLSDGRRLFVQPLDFGRSALFAADGKRIILSAQTSLTLHQLQIENGKLSLVLERDLKPAGAQNLHTSYLSVDRQWLGVAVDGQRLGLLDCRDFTTWKWLPVSVPTTTIAPSSGGRYAAGNHFNREDGLRVWDVVNGGESRLLSKGNSFAVFSPDGRWLADGGTDRLRVYETGTWRIVHEEDAGTNSDIPNRVAWTPDSRLLAFPKKRQFVCLLDTTIWQIVAELHDPIESPLSALCFSPDGSTLTTGRLMGGIGVWDLTHLSQELGALGLPWELPSSTLPAPTALPEELQEAPLPPVFAPPGQLPTK
jgi:WD40 repeat protein